MFTPSRHVPEGVTGEAIAAVTKATPPVTVSALSIAGVSLQDWVLIATLIYTVLQLLLLVPKVLKWLRELRRG